MDHVSEPTTVARRRRSHSEAVRLAVEYERSGLTRKAFCRQHGISVASLDSYRRLRTHHASLEHPAASDLFLAPVELIDRASSAQHPGTDAGIYLVLSNERRIVVASGFDAPTLARLIAVLEQS